jgi:tRNA pseudouridine55 synthase
MSDYHGLLLVNKPSGCTSHDVVAKIRKIFKTKEVGHTGTLDPLASGLMVVLLGEATKLSSYITEGHKTYQVDVRLGIVTDTLDITGTVLAEKFVDVDRQKIIDAALNLKGEMLFDIPMYSAKKIDGKKMYEYARENQVVEIPKKNMTFWDIENKSTESNLSFKISCSKGSFIRSWVKELGDQLGCGATMSGLIRLSSHHQNLSNAVDLDQLSESENLSSHLISMNSALPELKKIKIKGTDLKLIKNGQISHDLRSRLIILFNPETDTFVQVLDQNQNMVSIIGIEPEKGFRIKRVFN